MKTIEEMDKDADNYLINVEIERNYRKNHLPRVNDYIRDFVANNPELASECRRRYINTYNRDAKQRYADYRTRFEMTGDQSYLERMAEIKFKPKSLNNDLDSAKAFPIIEVFKMYGRDPITAGNGRFKVCCPFHNEKSPSLVIYKDTNSWYCFGCNKGGSPIDAVMGFEACDIKSAIRILTK